MNSRLSRAVHNDLYVQQKSNLSYVKDVLTHGCASGIVTSLITYQQTSEFYRKYKHDINALMADHGLTPNDLPDFDEEDPLCLEEHNQNIIAWWAYEAIVNGLVVVK